MDSNCWKVVFAQEFAEDFSKESEVVREKVISKLKLLKMFGPALGRDDVDTLYGSKMTNLKELRIKIGNIAYRVFFAFNPQREAVLLYGGDKNGDKGFYKRAIQIAEQRYLDRLK